MIDAAMQPGGGRLGQLGPVPPAAGQGVRTVPFDYVVTFPITGRRGTRHQNLVNISMVGPFVVTAIGYSLLFEDCFGLPEAEEERVSDPLLPGAILRGGGIDDNGGDELLIFGSPGARVSLIVNGTPAGGVQDLDSAGRTQVPLSSLSLSDTLRNVIVEDLTHGVSSPLIRFADFSTSPQFGPLRPRIGDDRIEVAGTPGSQIEVQLFGARPDLRPSGSRQLLKSSQVDMPDPSNPDPGFLSILLKDLTDGTQAAVDRLEPSDLLLLTDTTSGLEASWTLPGSPLDVRLSDLPLSALSAGFYVPSHILEALQSAGDLRPGDRERPFCRCGSGCEGFDFLYSIVDNGTSRAFQNEPIHNVAGLGIANGDRPFRQLPKPIVFDPKAVIRFDIEEISGGPGTLYIVLQGYKVIGGGVDRVVG